ncbi:MAG: right-handed parallel beta-helix repeat-containing protein [Pseudomonadota bacterium]
MQSRAAPERSPRRPRRRTGPVIALAALALLAGAMVLGAVLYLQAQGVAPRVLGPYIEQRAAGHNAAIVGTGRWLSALLMRQDRPAIGLPAQLPAAFGAQQAAVSSVPRGAQEIMVRSPNEVRAAIAAASAGQVITLAPGTYRFDSTPLVLQRGGAPSAPVVLRAALPGSVILELDLVEGFQVAAPYWTFENLTIRGACQPAASCEHAFHVVGRGKHFASLNNTITDFNAHFKINGADGQFPDRGRIIGNTLANSAVRSTASPVTPIDMVGASEWLVAHNLITDFIKGGGDRISYGAFAKGAGSDNRFSRNALVCEHRLQGEPGQRVGLSLGGGGTGKAYCRDQRCVVEQERGVIESNLISACSDAGIYLNNAAGSQVLHNSVIDTAGVQLRFPATSAIVEGNLVDGAIVVRNDAVLRRGDNLDMAIAQAYAGRHPVRDHYRAPQALDLAWSGAPPRRTGSVTAGRDLCASERPAARPAYGAIEDFSACLNPRRTD